jgi:probable rRNA maturation factor
MNDPRSIPGREAERGDRPLATDNPSLPRISVQNLQRKISLNIAELERFATNALQYCLHLRKGKRSDLRKSPELFVWLVSDRRMAMLHRKFLGEPGPTDVLTFQHGEIFISVETARRYAREFDNSLMGEIKLDIVHGLLHLHGFDHRTPADAQKMKTAQEKILRRALSC